MVIGIDASRAHVKHKTGTEWCAYFMIEEMKKIADPNDQFILYCKEYPQGQLAQLPSNFTIRVLKWPPQLLWTQLRLAWEMVMHKPDVLFVPAHTIPIAHPKKTITVLHDVGFEQNLDLYSKKPIGPSNSILTKILALIVKIISLGKYSNNELDYHRWSTSFALKHASSIITVSNFSKQEILKYFKADTNKIKIIQNSYDERFTTKWSDDDIKASLIKNNIKQPFFLYIGRLEEKKNIARIVQAFADFKKTDNSNYNLVLIGKPGFGYDKILKIIKESNLGNSIIMPGWVASDDIPKIMSAAEIFVFPTLYEGFGVPVLEAMASGTPVITSNNNATAEIAGQAAYIVDPYDHNEITKALERLTSNTSLRDQLIRAGYQRIKDFSWHRTAVKILDLLTH